MLHRTLCYSLFAAFAILLTACGPQDDGIGTDDTQAATAEAGQIEAPAPGPNAAASPELTDTSWRLVRIMSMDDTEWVPDDPSKYTLSFTGNDVSIGADCNRGKGSYASASPGQLTFGMIAATQALCAPDSISDIYMKQFQWVRSYVFEDGNLFLATMADGSIIEFEPLPD